MLKSLYNLNDREKHKQLVSVIKSRLSDFKDDIENMTEKKKEIEKPHKKEDIVENILYFNQLNQEGKGLKNSTPEQMLNRLPIL